MHWSSGCFREISHNSSTDYFLKNMIAKFKSIRKICYLVIAVIGVPGKNMGNLFLAGLCMIFSDFRCKKRNQNRSADIDSKCRRHYDRILCVFLNIISAKKKSM